MKRKMSIMIFSLVLILSACNAKEEPTSNSSNQPQASDTMKHTANPTETPQISATINPINNSTQSPQVSESTDTENPLGEQDNDNEIEVYGYDVVNERPISEQDDLYKTITTIYEAIKLYKYTDKNNLPIEEVALNLGKIVMEDMKTDYEGKYFVITDYKDFSVHVEKDDLGLKENQWLCKFDCKIKYTGNYATLGVLPEDMEWMEGIGGDGSGEDHYFVIEKISDTDYVMRGFPKCKRYLMKINIDNKQ